MNLVISSAWYPVCVATYLLRAARRAGHDVRTVGPTSGDAMPWEVPMEFPGYGVVPNIDPSTARVTMLGLRDVARWAHLWIDVDGGWSAGVDLPAARRVAVVTDPHVPEAAFHGDALRQFVDRTFVMQSPYARPGDGWLPYGFDPEWHRPPAEGAPVCDVDVTNLGAPYAERVAITESLEKAGLRVVGPGRCTIGPAYTAQLHRAPVAIVWPLADDLPARVFEALACGRAVMTKSVPDLERVAPVDFAGPVTMGPGLAAVSAPTSIAQFVEYVADVVRMGALAAEAKRCCGAIGLVSPAHSWDARLAQLIDGKDAP